MCPRGQRLKIPKPQRGGTRWRMACFHCGRRLNSLSVKHSRDAKSGRTEGLADPYYSAAWHDLRRIEKLRNLILITGFPLFVLLAEVLHPFNLDHFVFYLVAPIIVVFFVVLSLCISAHRCPRCSELFFYDGRWHNPCSKKCLHCGLPKWSLDPSSQAGLSVAKRLWISAVNFLRKIYDEYGYGIRPEASKKAGGTAGDQSETR